MGVLGAFMHLLLLVKYRLAAIRWRSIGNGSARNVSAPLVALEYRLAASRWGSIGNG